MTVPPTPFPVYDSNGTRRFGYVNEAGKKPKRRLFELLKAQGMQENQQGHAA